LDVITNFAGARYERRNALIAKKVVGPMEEEIESERVKTLLLDALEPYPDAWRAVAEALVSLGT
jgi:hypothetical protein